jgi:hypothetical protein
MKRTLVLDRELHGIGGPVQIADAVDAGRDDLSPATGRSADIRLFLLAFGAGFLFFSALIA